MNATKAPIYLNVKLLFVWFSSSPQSQREEVLRPWYIKALRHVGVGRQLHRIIEGNQFDRAAQPVLHCRGNKMVGNGGVLAQKRAVQVGADAVAVQGAVAARIVVVAVANVGNYLAERLQGSAELGAARMVLVAHYRLRGKLRFQRDVLDKAIESDAGAHCLQIEDGKPLYRFIAHQPIAAQNLVATANCQQRTVALHILAQLFAHAEQNLGSKLLLAVGAAAQEHDVGRGKVDQCTAST